jgi:hypothetical protein
MFKTRRIFPCGNEGAMSEEYCWAITQAAGRSCCGQSGSGVLELWFQLDSLIYSYTMTPWVLNYDLQKIDLGRISRNVLLSPSGRVCKVFDFRSPNALCPWDFPLNVIRLHFVSLHFPSHPIFVNIIAITIILCQKYKLRSPHFVISQPPVISCFVCPSVPVSTLFSYTLLREQVSEQCKTTGCVGVINTRCVDGRRSTKNTNYS